MEVVGGSAATVGAITIGIDRAMPATIMAGLVTHGTIIREGGRRPALLAGWSGIW